MKTTIDIANSLLDQAKQYGSKNKLTLKELVELSLKQYLDSAKKNGSSYSLPDRSFGEGGYQPGIEEGNWESLRAIIYQGRGD